MGAPLDENRDSGRIRDADGQQAAIRWQAEHFPQVAVSLGLRDSDFLPLTDAWRHDGTMVECLLDYQNRFAAGMDDRVRGAHLISFYSHHLSIAAAAVYLRTGLIPDLRPDRLAMRFEPFVQDGLVSSETGPSDARRLHFRFGRSLHRHDRASLLHDVFVEGFMPVIGVLQARTSLSPVAQWRLVADGIAGAFLEVGAALDEEERAMTAALAIINRTGSPFFSEAARYTKISAVCKGVPTERNFRLRGGCCLYYRTEGGDFCDVCVLLDGQTQKDRLRAHVERTGGL
ncbi:ferric iron reductase [Pararhizobium sp. YC-54]|uniref:ferric iron reductase n=1 Tax=Pararhizobium sp. YC-54 TaxID=2986920 RepID=UPI0021F7D2E8|nr:ferric iron reductase [Pararhizobium sp. YC-54]MCV9999911.1 ferric iron reductase [Pararhizobium sp. YC-54]